MSSRSTSATPDSTAARLVGAWELVSWDLSVDGERGPHGFGDAVTGLLLYLADGHMSAILSDPRRAPLSVEPFAAAPADERARASRSYVSYGGRWTVDGDQVRHHVEFCLLPNWVGTDLVRTVSWEDDDLVLATAPERDSTGRVVTNRLRWRRAG